MRKESTPAKFGSPDAEGFRMVSFYSSGGAEVLRLSLHIERFQQQLTRTSSSIEEYSDHEQDGLRAAAVIAAARKTSAVHDPNLMLATMLDLLIPKFVTEQTTKHFPELGWMALQAVQDACVKFAISGVVEVNNGPRIYGEETADWILRDLTATIREGFLRIKAGRPAEVTQQLQDTREAMNRIKKRKKVRHGKNPTQQQVADELKISVRALRNWPRACKLTWEEWLVASQWVSVERANVPDQWLTAWRKFESDAEGN